MNLRSWIILFAGALFVNAQVVEISSVSYHDTEGDGKIDNILMRLNESLEENEKQALLELIQFPDFRKLFIDSSEMKSDNTIKLHVSQNVETPLTSVSDEDFILISNGKLSGEKSINAGRISILDSIAPVILNADLIAYDNGDTLLKVTFSEPVNEISSDQPFRFLHSNNQYTVIVENSSVNGNMYTAKVSSEIISRIHDRDQVWINTNAKIVDIAGNIQSNPLNRRVNTVVNRNSNVIEFTASICYDTDADGFIDSITIEYNGSIEEIDSALIMEKIALPEWRNFTINSLSTDDSSLILSVQENRSIPITYTSNQDRIYVEEGIIPGYAFVRGVSMIMRDRVAPVIIDARYRNLEIGDDTLVVTFSEPVQTIYNSEPFVFRKHNDEIYSVVLERIESAEDDLYKGIVKSHSKPLEQNDSVWIDETASVMDVIGTVQNNTENRKVPLQVDFGNYPVRFTDAFYFDRDHNGFIDEIRLYYTGPIGPEDRQNIASMIILPESRELAIIGDPIPGGDGVLILRVEESSEEPRTGILPGDSISFLSGKLPEEGYLMASTLKIQDRMAPVIRSAHLDSYGNDIDTLKIIFSEPVMEFPSLRPFRLIKPDKQEYEILMYENAKFENDTYIAAMRSVLFGRQMQEGDLIWIQVLSVDVYDLEGNLQKWECNRRVYLSIDYHFSWRVVAENNPFIEGKRQIPQQVRNAYNESGKVIPQDGMIIVVEPNRQIREKISASATVSIYDAANNIVIKRQKLIEGTDRARLYYIWDGTNYKGRKAGSGTYLGIVRVKYNNKEYKTPINLGIKQ